LKTNQLNNKLRINNHNAHSQIIFRFPGTRYPQKTPHCFKKFYSTFNNSRSTCNKAECSAESDTN